MEDLKALLENLDGIAQDQVIAFVSALHVLAQDGLNMRIPPIVILAALELAGENMKAVLADPLPVVTCECGDPYCPNDTAAEA